MDIPIMARVRRFFGIQIIVRYVSTAAIIQSWPGNLFNSMSKTSIPITSHSCAVQNHANATRIQVVAFFKSIKAYYTKNAPLMQKNA